MLLIGPLRDHPASMIFIHLQEIKRQLFQSFFFQMNNIESYRRERVAIQFFIELVVE